MCVWRRMCDEVGNCKAAPPIFGCQQMAGVCEICALGFLSTIPGELTEPHRSLNATLGKLVEGFGWKVTRPGRGSGLSEGDIITHLNGEPLNTTMQAAQEAMLSFSNYQGGEVVLHVLRASGYRIEQVSFERS